MSLETPTCKTTLETQHTEVGALPFDWSVVPLISLAEKIMVGIASAATHAYRSSGVTMFRNQNIRPGVLDVQDVLYIDPQYEQTYRNKRLKSGDLLTARTGYPGTTSLVPEGFDGSQSFTTLITRPRSGSVDPRYLCLYINGRSGQKYFEQAQIGGGQKNVNAASLKLLPVAVPSTDVEQRVIADALTDADALIASMEQVLTKKRQIKQGTMEELLTGKRRLPGFVHPWQNQRLDEVADPVTRINHDAAQLPVITCSKHLGFVDSLGFFKNQVFSNNTTTYKIVLRGQIAYPANHIEEGSIGYQDLYDAALVSPIYVVFQPRAGINGKFLHRLLKLPQFLPVFGKYTSSSVDRRGSLRWPAFSAIEVTLPTEEEQLAVVQVIETLEAEVAAQEAQLAKACALKQAMAQALLTGRIRLVEPNA